MSINLDSITTLDMAKEIIAELCAEIGRMKEEVAREGEEIARQRAAIDQLKEENARLKGKDPDPSTPSGMTATFKKPDKKGRRNRPGRKRGHRGSRRPTPAPDRVEEHPLEYCPECGTRVSAPVEVRSRIVEDIPPVKPEIVEHRIHRCYCPKCAKIVEAPVTAALPRMQMGLTLLVTSAWMHYCLMVPVDKIIAWLKTICRLEVSAGGLTQMWGRLAERLGGEYDRIREAARSTRRALHADETGWRVNGRKAWLWVFTDSHSVYYAIEPTRSAKVIRKFLGRLFGGTLVCDFFTAYKPFVKFVRQRCLVHLLREFKKVSQTNRSVRWRVFCKKAKRLMRDAIRLAARRESYPADEYRRRRDLLHVRLRALTISGLEADDKDTRRLAKRLRDHHDQLFVFVDDPAVPSDNNHAERMVRPGAVARKVCYGNRSWEAAHTQSVLMSIFQTLRLRGENPVTWTLGRLERQITGNSNAVAENHIEQVEELLAA